MRRRILLLALLVVLAPAGAAFASTTPPTPPVTVNEFIPVERGLGECISALPKPGCGSEARGGWRQALVLLAILVGLAIIVWRVVASARRARAAQQTSVS